MEGNLNYLVYVENTIQNKMTSEVFLKSRITISQKVFLEIPFKAMVMTTSLTPAALMIVMLSLLVTWVSASFWGYEHGPIGLDPKHWEPEVCQTGKNQSPISMDPSQNKRKST